jgi:hypothetical protein
VTDTARFEMFSVGSERPVTRNLGRVREGRSRLPPYNRNRPSLDLGLHQARPRSVSSKEMQVVGKRIRLHAKQRRLVLRSRCHRKVRYIKTDLLAGPLDARLEMR